MSTNLLYHPNSAVRVAMTRIMTDKFTDSEARLVANTPKQAAQRLLRGFKSLRGLGKRGDHLKVAQTALDVLVSRKLLSQEPDTSGNLAYSRGPKADCSVAQRPQRSRAGRRQYAVA